MPTLRRASSFLFDLIDHDVGLINAPGSLYIDASSMNQTNAMRCAPAAKTFFSQVFIRGNFTSDSNAMAVIFFREFAAAEAAVGNSTGAAALLQVAPLCLKSADRFSVLMSDDAAAFRSHRRRHEHAPVAR
jgi:hypothetical protein